MTEIEDENIEEGRRKSMSRRREKGNASPTRCFYCYEEEELLIEKRRKRCDVK